MTAKRHGETNTRLYRIWCGMLTRCKNPARRNFKWYGGRGITVCERWKLFENFRDDMGQPPPGATIDRKDGDGNYEPGNCRWADKETQHNNRSNNRKITIAGEELSIAQAARKYGVGYRTMQQRLNRGWNPDRAASDPILEKHDWRRP